MNWWQALILGIVEGLTEYLPVSSTGHLILVQWLIGLGGSEAVNHYNIAIQAGAIAAVLGLYGRRVRQLALGVLGRDPAGLKLAVNLAISFLPAAVLGPLLKDRIESELFAPWPVISALFVGGWLMLAVARNQKLGRGAGGRTIEDMDWRLALLVGFGQCIAMWPGTSRSMMTIVAALLLGMRAAAAAEFSFLLGFVTLTAATGYSVLDSGPEMLSAIGWAPFVVGFLAATGSAALAVRGFVLFLDRYGLAPFAWYRLALAALLALLILSGTMPAFDAGASP